MLQYLSINYACASLDKEYNFKNVDSFGQKE